MNVLTPTDETTISGPISLEQSLIMYARVNVQRELLHAALRELAPKHLKPAARASWTPDNPTRNFCYVVSEWVLHYRAPAGTKAFNLEIPGEPFKHWFLRLPDGALVDLTAEQFPDYSVVNYAAAKRGTFMHPSPSRRARELQDRYALLYAQYVGMVS